MSTAARLATGADSGRELRAGRSNAVDIHYCVPHRSAPANTTHECQTRPDRMSEGDHSAGHRRRKDIAELVSVKMAVQDDLLAIPGVVSVGLGYKRVGGDITRELAIVAFVQEKRMDLQRDECVPFEVDGVPTDVVEIGRVEISRLVQRSTIGRSYDPMAGGCSIGSCRPFVQTPPFGLSQLANTTPAGPNEGGRSWVRTRFRCARARRVLTRA